MPPSASPDDHPQPGGPSGSEGASAEGRPHRPDAPPDRSFFGALLYRRVPQVLAGYLGVTWTLFELMQWLTEQYLLSPYLGRAILLGLLLLLPSVLVVTYRHGRPGPDRWTSAERWTLAGNGGVALLVLMFAFGDVELGSMVRTVQTSAADTIGGTPPEQVIRQVPKKQFRRRVALFYFDEAEGARADTALRRAVPTALRADLEQDPFVSAFSPVRFEEELQQRGYEKGLDVPLGLKREAAQGANAGYVLSGRVGTTRNGQTVLSTRLRETETGDLVAEHQFEGEDLFDTVDRASTQLKRDLDLPDGHLESATDLPVTQVFTASKTAAKHYAQGRHLRWTDTQGAARRYGRATDADTTFALGYLQEGRTLWRLGKREQAQRAFERAKRHSYRLSESRTYWLKATSLYRLDGQPEAALQVCKRWTSLHPYDLSGWRLKAAIQGGLLRHEEALASYRHMLELAPDSKRTKRSVVGTLMRTGRFEEALRKAESFAAEYPEDDIAPLLIGVIHWRLGRLTRAEDAFQRADRMGSQDTWRYLSVLDQARGQYDSALSRIREASDEQGGARYELRRVHHHWLRGRIDRSRRLLDSLWTTMSEMPAGRDRSFLAARACDYHGPSGEDAFISKLIEQLEPLPGEASLNTPVYKISAQAALSGCKIAADTLTEAQKHLERATTLVERPGTPSFYRLLLDLDYLWGRLREAQGRHQDAAARYERYLDDASPRSLLLRTRRHPRLRLARSYQKAGRTGDARETYQEALTLRPASPRLNYHYAQFLVDQGRREAARPPLRRALEAWTPADADFRPKQKAETLADSLGLGIA